MKSGNITVGVFRRDIAVLRRDKILLFDRQADAYYRVSEKAAQIVSYMTEVQSVEEFRAKLFRFGIEVTEQEIISLLAFLQQNDLLEPEYSRLSAKKQQITEMKEKSRLLRLISAYMYFRLPPWYPEKFFEKIAPFVSFLASKWFIMLLLIPAAAGYLLALRDFSHVRTVFVDTLSWAGAAKYFAAILLLKVIHEAAHSLAAIHFNCRVRGIGIGFILFYPRLYTDTTDSWTLLRRQRLLIDAAGIISELLAGGIAALLYFYLPPGAWKSTMFYIFTVSTLSTLLVNGNPCIRYDGYYILCDLTGVDNLMMRSAEYVKKCWRYWLLRLGTKPEKKNGFFLFVFGVSSFVYRIFLYTAIILIIYHRFIKVLAVILLLCEIATLFILPCIREIRTVRALSKRSGGRAAGILCCALTAVILLLLFIPLPWSYSLPGIVVPEKRILVPAAESGYLKHDMPIHPVRVSAEDVLAEFESSQLRHARDKVQYLLELDRCQYDIESVDEKKFAGSQVTLAKISSDVESLAELDRRTAALKVCAPADGTFRVFRPAELTRGRFVPRGAVLGEVVSGKLMIYAYGDDRDAARLRPGEQAKVSVADDLTVYSAVVGKVDQVALPLKDSPLLQVFGGVIPMYQNEKEPGRFHSVHLCYRAELILPPNSELSPGRRVTCRIKHTEKLWNMLFSGVMSVFRKEM